MDNCPRCGADAITPYDLSCGSKLIFQKVVEISDRCRINQALAICRRHASPAVNTGAHALAQKLIGVLSEGIDNG